MDAKDEVKSRLSIEDVISSYLDLKRAGRNWKALSPFTNEKSPSFIVSPEKQIWHDFSSGKGGDVFSFVMEVEGLDFKDALELLARRAGVDLSQYDRSSRGSSVNKNRLYEAIELSAKFYQVQFSKNKAALNYVIKSRGFTKNTALTWRLGYSPNTGDALTKFLKSKNFTTKELSQAGLISSRGDMFRGRLMIPLSDAQGRVIGFTARSLDQNDHGPKYINTPQTVLYDKSRHVFGLDHAKSAIRQAGYVTIVEGNMDVIASYQAGVKQVVATAGTALTTFQLQALSRLTNDIRLCFDADKAGVSATERSIPIASNINVNLSVISLQSGKDPDELIRQDPSLWQKDIENKKYAVDWLIDHYRQILDLNSAPGKRQFTDKLLPIVASLEDDVEKDHYINTLAKMISVKPEAIYDKLSKASKPKKTLKKHIKTQEELDQNFIEAKKVQDGFLSLMLNRVTLRELMARVTEQMFVTKNGRNLFKLINDNPELKPDDSKYHRGEIGDYVKIEVLLYEELYSSLDLNELHYEAVRLRTRLIENYVKSQKTKLIESLSATTDETKTRELLEKAKELDKLLSQSEEEV